MAFVRSCSKVIDGADDGTWAGRSPVFGSRQDWQDICAAAHRVVAMGGDGRRFFEAWFVPYLAGDNGRSLGLFTGYYEPLLRGSMQRGTRYRVPLYRPPPYLREAISVAATAGRDVSPLPTRASIEAGALAGQGLELLWLDDPIDAFFLHVQGSGRVVLDDGRIVRVGYAGKNGHPYVPIGRELVRLGAIAEDQVSLQTIRTWLRAHPQQAAAVMALNPSFVFFRLVDGDGPIGTAGVPLSAERSLAVDAVHIPLGIPIWLQTDDPRAPGRPLHRLVVAQDTGGAIRGPVRGDLFWGPGIAAEEAAGRMRGNGRYFLLLPRAAAR